MIKNHVKNAIKLPFIKGLSVYYKFMVSNLALGIPEIWH